MENILNFSANTPESKLRLAIVACGEICYSRHLLISNDGNISVRLSADAS